MAIEHANSWEGDERLGWDPEWTEEEEQDYSAQFYENVEGSWEFITDED